MRNRLGVDLTEVQWEYVDILHKTSGNSKASLIRFFVMFFMQHNPVSESRLEQYREIIRKELADNEND